MNGHSHDLASVSEMIETTTVRILKRTWDLHGERDSSAVFAALAEAGLTTLGGDEERRELPTLLLVARLLGPLIPRRYRPVPTRLVAQAMLDACLRADPGVHVIESGRLLEPG